MGRVCHLTTKIYREMSFITRHEKTTYITMGGYERVQVGPSWTPPYRIVLSWELLAWITMEGRIPCSFTNFITTPELSGPLYISGHFMSELLSLCIDHLPNCYPVRRSVFFVNPDSDSIYREHFCRALPTEMFFYLLRSIPSVRLIHDYSVESMLDMLEIIIKWLQVSVSECN